MCLSVRAIRHSVRCYLAPCAQQSNMMSFGKKNIFVSWGWQFMWCQINFGSKWRLYLLICWLWFTLMSLPGLYHHVNLTDSPLSDLFKSWPICAFRDSLMSSSSSTEDEPGHCGQAGDFRISQRRFSVADYSDVLSRATSMPSASDPPPASSGNLPILRVCLLLLLLLENSILKFNRLEDF